MTASRIQTTSIPRSENAVLAARVLTAALVVLSSIALFSIPLGEYDDSLVLVGARLISAGELPYLDFYTHYGPFGYTLVGLLIRLTRSPALALRLAESGLLAGLAILTHTTVRRAARDPARSESTVPFAVMVFSAAALFPSFPGLAFAAAALDFFILGLRSPSRSRGDILTVTGGISLSVAALIRPAFAAYVAGALLVISLFRLRSPIDRRWLIKIALFFATALMTAALLWSLLYQRIPIRTALDAVVLSPAHLTSGGDRYLEPDFLRRGAAAAIAAGVAIAGISLVWGFAIPSRLARTRTTVCMLVMGLLPFLLRYCVGPGGPLPFLGLLLFPLPVLLVFSERRSLREDADLAFAAAFGVSAAAFGHYFWIRADAPHLLPFLAVGSCGAALISGRLRLFGSLAVLVLFLAGYDIAARNWHLPLLPIARLFEAKDVRATGGSSSPTARPRFGCQEVPEDAARAVSLADKGAASESRFVAVASSHVSTQGNPVLLFVLSSRLPYTKWFQYDPDLQSSARIQREMERELLASGSRTAVVWRADRFVFDRRTIPTDETSSFDEFFNRLYPVSIGRFGDYEVRSRSPVAAGARR
jgi:hypothetical protein